MAITKALDSRYGIAAMTRRAQTTQGKITFQNLFGLPPNHVLANLALNFTGKNEHGIKRDLRRFFARSERSGLTSQVDLLVLKALIENRHDLEAVKQIRQFAVQFRLNYFTIDYCLFRENALLAQAKEVKALVLEEAAPLLAIPGAERTSLKITAVTPEVLAAGSEADKARLIPIKVEEDVLAKSLGLQIVLVDDQSYPDNVALLLEKLGFTDVRVYGDPLQLLTDLKARKIAPAIVVSDLEMGGDDPDKPGLNGDQLMEKIAEMMAVPPRFILCSGTCLPSGEGNQTVKIREKHGIDYIQKQHFTTLLARIQDLARKIILGVPIDTFELANTDGNDAIKDNRFYRFAGAIYHDINGMVTVMGMAVQSDIFTTVDKSRARLISSIQTYLNYIEMLEILEAKLSANEEIKPVQLPGETKNRFAPVAEGNAPSIVAELVRTFLRGNADNGLLSLKPQLQALNTDLDCATPPSFAEAAPRYRAIVDQTLFIANTSRLDRSNRDFSGRFLCCYLFQ